MALPGIEDFRKKLERSLAADTFAELLRTYALGAEFEIQRLHTNKDRGSASLELESGEYLNIKQIFSLSVVLEYVNPLGGTHTHFLFKKAEDIRFVEIVEGFASLLKQDPLPAPKFDLFSYQINCSSKRLGLIELSNSRTGASKTIATNKTICWRLLQAINYFLIDGTHYSFAGENFLSPDEYAENLDKPSTEAEAKRMVVDCLELALESPEDPAKLTEVLPHTLNSVNFLADSLGEDGGLIRQTYIDILGAFHQFVRLQYKTPGWIAEFMLLLL